MGELDLGGSAVIDALEQPVIVVDDDDEVVAYNGAFGTLVGVEDDHSDALDSLLAGYPDLLNHIENRTEDVAELERKDERHFVEICFSPVSDANGDPVGDLCLLHDVTEQQRRHRDLERQNEQLDEFASLITHDLRNPLDVAIGRATVLRELTDSPDLQDHFDELDAAHGRMRQIIQDVLTLARQGRSIDDKSPVSLTKTAKRAWAHVDTAGATLTVDTDLSVSADPERLEQVFENLFRNSIEHGGTSEKTVDITVGELPDRSGFYVADNGPGIPEDERSEVFEAGHSGDSGNTGLGLAIVRSITEAHGWSIQVTSSQAGGARFKFEGVTLRPDSQTATTD